MAGRGVDVCPEGGVYWRHELAPHLWVMHTRFPALREVGSVLGLFLSLPDEVGPLSVLLNAGWCECLWRDLALLAFCQGGGLASFQRTHRLPGYLNL